jgi:hypothetical protein
VLSFEIIKYDDKDTQVVSTARNEEITIVDIEAVKGFGIGDVDKFYIPTDASDSDNGAMYGLKTTTEGAIYIKAPAILEEIPGKYQHSISVKGTYNNTDVNIPDHYLVFNADKLVFGDKDINKVVSTSDDAIKWNDFYDLGKFGFPRKDSDDTITVEVLDASGVEVLDTLSKKVVLSDAKPGLDKLTAKEAVTLTPNGTKIWIDVDDVMDTVKGKLAKLADKITNTIELKAKDQYGQDWPEEELKADITFKVASVEVSESGYADNNFKVFGNDTNKVSIEGAERGDTFVLTVSLEGKTVEVKVTVGADKLANITGSNNNYRDTLVKTGVTFNTPLEDVVSGLEEQRQCGLQ